MVDVHHSNVECQNANDLNAECQHLNVRRQGDLKVKLFDIQHSNVECQNDTNAERQTV